LKSSILNDLPKALPLVLRFVKALPESVAKLDELSTTKELHAIGEIAHKLVGSASLHGYDDLAALAKELLVSEKLENIGKMKEMMQGIENGVTNIVVTGAAGFIGSNLTLELLRLGYNVTGIDSFTPYYDVKLKEQNASDINDLGGMVLNVDLAEVSLAEGNGDTQNASFREAKRLLKEAHFIFHAAAQPGICATTPFSDYLRNNIIATENLLGCVGENLRCFVNIATSSIYGLEATESEDHAPKPISVYGATKLCAESLVLAAVRSGHIPGCSLRLFSVYGPRERPDKLYPLLISSLLKDVEFPLYEGSLDHSRSFTFIDDVVAAFISVLSHPETWRGEILNIGSDTEITTRTGIEIVSKLLGRLPRFKMMGKRLGDQQRTTANIQKARALLGFNPKYPPEEGLSRQIAWFKDRA
jgi:nucleoside-diphosphate-sugar epimerase